MQIKLINGDDPYKNLICHYFSRSFPRAIASNSAQLLEILTTILIGDKNTRYGPIPVIEHQAIIRKVITDSIAKGLPIPVLIPWGGRKLDKNCSLDVAEVAALRQILGTDELVRRFYAPGLRINVRIEDINAEWLYKEEEGIFAYSNGMVNLINMLRGDSEISGVMESEIMDKFEYLTLSAQYSSLLAEVIIKQMASPGIDVEDIDSYHTLLDMGWVGKIPPEQIYYYIDRYNVLEPGKTEVEYAEKLADYLGGAAARHKLNGKGNPQSDVTGYIQINFAHPVPGAPVTLFNNTLYYRTVPMSDGKTHIAPWRSKGYLFIGNDNSVSAKVTSFGNKGLIDEMNDAKIEMIEGKDTLTVCAHYMAQDLPIPFMGSMI